MKEKYLIGYVSRILNISKDTLRYYDKLGIVSPKKDASNSYRYYTLEDLLALSYVLIFKDLEIPLEEIKQLIQHNTLDDFKHLLDKQELLIDTRIAKLIALKNKVSTYKSYIETTQACLGQIQLTYNPPFVYQPTQTEWDANYVDYLTAMETHDNITSPVFSTLSPSSSLSPTLEYTDMPANTLTFNNDFCYGVSGIVKDLSLLHTLSQYEYIAPTLCMHTVIAVQESILLSDLEPFKDYMATHQLAINGSILTRNIAFEHVNQTAIDYYEVWIPIST